MKEITGEQLPIQTQRQLRVELIADIDQRDLLRTLLDYQDCECSDNVDEQIWTSPTSSYTTRPFLSCLKCRGEILLYPVAPRRKEVR